MTAHGDAINDALTTLMSIVHYHVSNPDDAIEAYQCEEEIRNSARAVLRVTQEALQHCGCTPMERESGHKVDCPVPRLQDDLERALAGAKQGIETPMQNSDTDRPE